VTAYHHRSRASRSSGERGVALVELSFILLIMFLMIAGAIDYGLGWRSGMAITEAARTGARVGSGQANNRAADYNAMSGMRAALLSSGTLDNVEQVIVYRADTAAGTVPAGCKTATSGDCIVYTGDQFRALDDRSGWNLVWPADPEEPPTGGNGCPNNAQRVAWCPTSRVNQPQGSAEYLGIYIKYRHDHLFPWLLGDDTVIERSAVMRLEPPSL
jgi:hypothetical protein